MLSVAYMFRPNGLRIKPYKGCKTVNVTCLCFFRELAYNVFKVLVVIFCNYVIRSVFVRSHIWSGFTYITI